MTREGKNLPAIERVLFYTILAQLSNSIFSKKSVLKITPGFLVCLINSKIKLPYEL